MRRKNRRRRDTEKGNRWRGIIREAARSGMSIREFCRRRGLTESQFYWWQRNLKGRQQRRRFRRRVTRDSAASPVSFALVQGESTDRVEAGIELVLSDGRRLAIGKGVDAETLRTVLEVVEEGAGRSPGETASSRC